LSDDELGGLIRSAADAWRPPPERLGRDAWEDRARRGRAATPSRLVAVVGVALLATIVLAFSAPYFGLLRQLGVGPTGSPSASGATASAMPTPLPKLAIYGDPLPATRLVVGDYQYEILDLSNGTLSGSLGPGPGCDSVARTGDGSIACAIVQRTGAPGAVRVRLALVDASSETTSVVTLADYAPDAYPQADNGVGAHAVFDATGGLVYVGHVVRHADTWSIAIDVFGVPGGTPLGTLEVGTIPATGGLIGTPGNGAGQSLDPELVAPQLRIAPDGRHLVARSDLVENQGPPVSRYWSISLGADAHMSDPRPWPSGTTAGSVDDCLGDDGFASDSMYYLLCGPGLGTSVRRVDLAGALLGDTPIPSAVQTYPLATAVDQRAGALCLWSGVTRSIARIDLATGALTGPITAPVASASGPLGALGALAGGISDWLAPNAAAKVFLQPGIVVSADGSRIYALGLAHGEPGPLQSTGIYVFEAPTLRQVDHWSPTADFVSLAVSPDGTLLYAAGTSGDLSVPTGAAQASVTVFDTATGKVHLIAGQLGLAAVFFPAGGLLEAGN
jgi:hypothetical protein